MFRAFPPIKLSSTSTPPLSFTKVPDCIALRKPVQHQPRLLLRDTDGETRIAQENADTSGVVNEIVMQRQPRLACAACIDLYRPIGIVVQNLVPAEIQVSGAVSDVHRVLQFTYVRAVPRG